MTAQKISRRIPKQIAGEEGESSISARAEYGGAVKPEKRRAERPTWAIVPGPAYLRHAFKIRRTTCRSRKFGPPGDC